MFSNDRSAKGLVPGLHKWKTKYTTTIQPRSLIPGHLSQRSEDVFTSKTRAQKWLAALSITATNCKPPRCPLTSRQVNKQGHVRALELPSGLRKKEPGHTRQPGGTSKGFGECKQPSPPRYELCDVTYMTKFEMSSRVKEGMGLRVWVMMSGRGYRRAAGGSLWWWPCLCLVSVLQC